MPTAMSSDLTHAPPLDLRTGVRTSEADSGGFIRHSRAAARPRTPGRLDLIVDVHYGTAWKLGVALYSEVQRRRNAAFLRGVNMEDGGWEIETQRRRYAGQPNTRKAMLPNAMAVEMANRHRL